MKSIKVFVSYAHEDEQLRQQLETHLSLLRRQGLISEWNDRQISAGMEWVKQIDAHLETASLILLLISPDFLASNYCYDTEMKRALERHQRGEARVIPIILRPVDWHDAPFGKLQVLPTGAQPIQSPSWHSLDEAFLDVVTGIRKVIKELNVTSSTPFFRASDQWSLTIPSAEGIVYQHTRLTLPLNLNSLYSSDATVSVKVALLGPSASGKTSFTAAMYAAFYQGINGFTFLRKHLDLDRVWKQICDEHWPPPTPQQTQYSFDLCYEHKRIANLDWIDYCGGLLMERSSNPDVNMLLDFLRKASCIVLCIPAEYLFHAETGDRSRRSISRLLILLSHLYRSSSESLPSLVILITKFDEIHNHSKDEVIEELQTLLSPVFEYAFRSLLMLCPVTLSSMLSNDTLRAGISPQNIHLPVAFSVYEALRKNLANLQKEKKLEKYAEMLKDTEESLKIVVDNLMKNTTVYYAGKEFIVDI